MIANQSKGSNKVEIRFPTDPPFPLPSDPEASQLFLMVARKFPFVIPQVFPSDQARNACFKQFVFAIRRIAHLHRVDTLGRRQRADIWLGEIEAWYQQRGEYHDIGLNTLTAACLVMDCLVGFTKEQWPHDVYLGLAHGTATGARMARPAWRDVLLKTKQLPDPIVVRVEQQQRVQQLLIR